MVPYVLLDASDENPRPEKSAPMNIELSLFDVVEEIKATVGKRCPAVVSRADILIYAMRDASTILSNDRVNFDVPAGIMDLGLVPPPPSVTHRPHLTPHRRPPQPQDRREAVKRGRRERGKEGREEKEKKEREKKIKKPNMWDPADVTSAKPIKNKSILPMGLFMTDYTSLKLLVEAAFEISCSWEKLSQTGPKPVSSPQRGPYHVKNSPERLADPGPFTTSKWSVTNKSPAALGIRERRLVFAFGSVKNSPATAAAAGATASLIPPRLFPREQWKCTTRECRQILRKDTEVFIS
uniref:Plant heme peroxidase family profile domain-containing protein n=1 Tax=Oryza brachyantha TaxID=4533 RepID=J3MKH5_ORYBR